LTNAAVKLFENFSYGELQLLEESEIEKSMKLELSWNTAKITCESECQRSYKGAPSEFNDYKSKFVTEGKLKKILSSKWKSFKKEWPLFDKLPHFAITRLKVFQ
jgi:hypothetical protein